MGQAKQNQNPRSGVERDPATAQQLVRNDFGSEVLPTDISVNPWDVPGGPNLPSPSGLVAGDGASDIPSDGSTGAED